MSASATVEQFRRLSDEGRYRKARTLLAGTSCDQMVLDYRANLVTALREAEVYPRKSYKEPT